MRRRTLRFIERCDALASVKVEAGDAESMVGGGAAPDNGLRTSVVLLSAMDLDAEQIAQRFREHDPPIIPRIVNDRVLIDLRTVSESDEDTLADAISLLGTSDSAKQTHA